MSKLPAGYYRKLLSSIPEVQIVTNKPIINTTKVDTTKVIAILENSLDELAHIYIDGLRAGELCCVKRVCFTNQGNDHFNPLSSGRLHIKY